MAIVYRASWLVRRLLTSIGLKRSYSIGAVQIKLDYTHRLPDYQEKHPLYDRFLPHLAKYLPPSSIVVDVGANVGDTVAGMIDTNSSLKYVCIEADAHFYNDLVSNVRLIKEIVPEARIYPVNEFVGRKISNVRLTGSGGTKSAVVGEGEIKAKTLTEIMTSLNFSGNVLLIKTDVDGFDYDVIRSSDELLETCPLLYLECYYRSLNQLNGYLALLKELLNRGYSSFALFDNFGQYLLTVNSVENAAELLRYVYRQNSGNGTRTINYLDILAYDKAKRPLVDVVLDNYLNFSLV